MLPVIAWVITLWVTAAHGGRGAAPGAPDVPDVPAKLLARLNTSSTGGASSHADFGTAVAVVSGYAIVGAQNDADGSVWVFSSEDGRFLGRIASPVGLGKGANFGCALAACGRTLVVGAQYAMPGQNGAVSVYRLKDPSNIKDGDEGLVTLERILRAPKQLEASRFFGGAVSLDCSPDSMVQNLVVGAASGNGSGSVLWLGRDLSKGLNWSVEGVFRSPLSAGVNFGQSVASLSSFAVVGANHAENSTGAVFRCDAPSHCYEAAAAFRSVGGFLGTSIASAPSGIYAASSPWSLGGNGSISFFSPEGRELHVLRAPDGLSGGNFGIRLAFMADAMLWASAWTAAGGGAVLAYTYEYTPSVSGAVKIKYLGKISPPDPVYSSAALPRFFGSSLAVSGDRLLVGADGDLDDVGAAYLYELVAVEYVE